jgi:hypothetical protein
MRLTEALVKDMFGRAIDSGKVKELSSAFKKHLNIENKFVRNEGKRGWKKVSLYGYECWRFAEESDVPGRSKIERVIRDVWGDGQGILTEKDVADLKAVPVEAHTRFMESYCSLWKDFNKVMQLTRRKTQSAELHDYGARCRDLGARWCLLLPSNRCSAFYLHTLLMHGGDFMDFCLKRGLTIGMLENSGAERRHEVGRVQFKKSLSGGGKAYMGMKASENRSAYLTLRGLLIWQYGRDYLAFEAARAEYEALRSGPPKADRTRGGSGWDDVQDKVTAKLHQFRKMQDKSPYGGNDDELEISADLHEAAFDALEHAEEGDAPPVSLLRDEVSLPEAEDLHFGYTDGTTVNLETGEMDGCEAESEAGSCGSSISGSDSDSDSESDIDFD